MASLLIQSIPGIFIQTSFCPSRYKCLLFLGQWSNPVDDLVKIFQQHDEGRNLWLLLALLTVIPEEFSTQVKQVFSKNYESYNKHELISKIYFLGNAKSKKRKSSS